MSPSKQRKAPYRDQHRLKYLGLIRVLTKKFHSDEQIAARSMRRWL